MKHIEVICNNDSIEIDGKELSFPILHESLEHIFGEPEFLDGIDNFIMWDEYGICARSYASDEDYTDIYFFISNHSSDLLPQPKQLFRGKIFFQGKEVLYNNSFEYFEFDEYYIASFLEEEANKPFAISLSYLFKEEDIPKDKYQIKKLDEDILEFKDFGFKLSIIQELMYNKELLKPKFDIYEFEEWYDKRSIDLEKEGYAPIAEVTQYFKELPIPKNTHLK